MLAKAEAAGIDTKLVQSLLARTEFNETTGCLTWTGGLTPYGYGATTWNGEWRYVHRIGYEIGYGPVPEGLSVLHSCNQRNCANPEHLRAGTAAENMADAVAAGTAGRPRGRALSDRQMAEITGLQLMGWNATEIRKETGISFSVIHAVKKGGYRPDAISDELDRVTEGGQSPTNDQTNPDGGAAS